jgi:Nif-specific regulatory protein
MVQPAAMSDSPPPSASVPREHQELALLEGIATLIDSERDARVAMQGVLEVLARDTGLQRPTIWLRTPGEDTVRVEAAVGMSESERARGAYRIGEGVTGAVVASGTARIVEDVDLEAAFLGRAAQRRRLRAKRTSYICVPLRSAGQVLGAISADRVGAFDATLVADARLLHLVGSLIGAGVLELYRALADGASPRSADAVEPALHPDWMIGNSKPMQAVYRAIAQVAAASTTALIVGESGTGKELVARALHEASDRADAAFIKVNCGAIPEGVIESELFGHERGAFTGAVAQRKGRFELADGGTIFLDEIGELSPTMQVRLLRVLQEREFERVGGTRTLRTDVRVIAATSRDLEALIELGAFRPDLYYRLHVFPIHVPPLRERGSDVIALTDHFVSKFNKRHLRSVRRVATSALDALTAYHWPGNVRELENCIERAVLISTDDVIHAHNLPPSLQTGATTGTETSGDLQVALDNLERALILDALKATEGNLTRAAQQLNVTERIMGLRVKKHAIDPARFRRTRS